MSIPWIDELRMGFAKQPYATHLCFIMARTEMEKGAPAHRFTTRNNSRKLEYLNVVKNAGAAEAAQASPSPESLEIGRYYYLKNLNDAIVAQNKPGWEYFFDC